MSLPRGQTRVRVHGRSAKVPGRGALAVARALGIELQDARTLLSGDRVLPGQIEPTAAEALVHVLREQGLSAELVSAPSSTGRCPSHPSLDIAGVCERCQASICELCALKAEAPWCTDCALRQRRQERFRILRLAVLGVFFLAIASWALRTWTQREERTFWERPLQVAVVLLAEQPVSPREVDAWRTGARELSDWVGIEFVRHQSENNNFGNRSPVQFELFGPTHLGSPPPFAPEDETWLARTRHTWSLFRYFSDVHQRVKLDAAAYEARIYVELRSDTERGQFVEGVGEAGGDLGRIRAPLGDTDLGLALTAVVHELFHCLGATDKYGADGHAVLPDGLVDPEADPLFPQKKAEVMVGERPLGPKAGKVPRFLSEVGVGPVTARELRWLPGEVTAR